MTNERQINLKQMAEQEANQAQQQAACGSETMAQTPLYRQSMRDRFDSRRADLERRAQQTDKLRELVMLLDTNPVIARILDLFEEVGNY